MSAFRWVILSLALYRPVRFIAADDFPPMIRARTRLVALLGGDKVGQWGKLITCSWCLSVYIVTIGYLVDHYYPIPLPVLMAGATMTVVGMIGNYDT